MGILYIIIAAGFLILTYILFIPVKVYVNLRIDEKVSAISGIKAFPFELHFISGKSEAKQAKPEEAGKIEPSSLKTPEKKEKKIQLSKLTTVDIGVLLGVVSEFFKFLGRLFKAPDRYFIQAEISGGLSEPNATGELYGAYHVVKAILPGSVMVDYQPDFLSEKIKGTVNFGFVIRLFNVLKEIAVLIFRLPVVRLIKLYRKIKVKNGGRNV